MPPPDVVAPELATQRVPSFPSLAAIRNGQQGHLVAEATIGPDGRVTDARIIRSPAGGVFDAAALEALTQWSFRPATRAGTAVAVTGIFTFRFTIVVDEATAAAETAADAGQAEDPRSRAVQMGAPGLIAPRQLTVVLPEYTDEAREAGVEGDVYIEAVVTREGTVIEPELVRGLPEPELNRRALEAITRWTFEPGRQNDEPVDVLALFTVTYRLQ